jgi:selenide,water dikinase
MSPAAPIAPAGASERRELVLVGAGHAHVQLLRSFAMQPPPAGVRLTLVVDTPLAVYSGMVPGLVAGRYEPGELAIDALPLARRAGARVVLAAATGIEPRERRILVAGRPPLPYDLASIDIGSSVAGLDLPGVREHALATRPIGRFAGRVAEVEAAARRKEGTFRLVVAGGGAAGVELAATFQARLARLERRGEGRPAQVTLVHEAADLLPGSSQALGLRAARALERREIGRAHV